MSGLLNLFELEKPKETSYPVICDGGHFGQLWAKVRCTSFVDDDWGEPELTFSLDCEGIPYDHPLNCELNTESFSNLVEYYMTGKQSVESFMLHEGICPNQRFWVTMVFEYHRDYEGDWDLDIDIDVYDVEPVPHAEALSRWEAFWKVRDEYTGDED